MTKVIITDPGATVVDEGETTLKVVVADIATKVTVEEPIVKVVPNNVGIQGPPGPQGTPGVSTFQTIHTWAVAGEIRIANGEDDFIPPMFIALGLGQTAVVAEVRHRLNSGGSTQVKLQKNGVDLTGYTGINVTTTPGVTDPADQPVADGDLLALVVVNTSGLPMNMTFTVVLEHLA